MKYATGCDTGVQKEHNEDSIAVDVVEDNHLNRTRDAGLFVLADGAGGADAGEVASYIATTVVLDELSEYLTPVATSSPRDIGVELGEQFTDSTDTDDEAPGDSAETTATRTLVFEEPSSATIEEALEDAIHAAQEPIQAYAAESSGNLYTTIVVGLYNDGTFQYAWAGDSRGYVLNTDHERLEPLTVDHSKVQRMEDQEQIDETAAKVHPDGNQITNALGIQDVRIDTGEVDLYEGDVVLITSDGLIDAYPHYPHLHREYVNVDDYQKFKIKAKIENSIVTDQEIRDVLLQSLGSGEISESDLQTAVDVLLTLGNNRGGKDNMSLILFQSETFGRLPEELPVRGVEAEEEPDDSESQSEDDERDEGDDQTDAETADDTGAEASAKASASTDQEGTGETATADPASDADAEANQAANEETAGEDPSASSTADETGDREARTGADEEDGDPGTDDGDDATTAASEPAADATGETSESESAAAADTAGDSQATTDADTGDDTPDSEGDATEDTTESNPDTAEDDGVDECPDCGSDISGYDGVTFCPECGTDITA